MLVEVNTPIVIVAEIGKEKDVITRLARVGFDQVLGYLEGGFESWKKQGLEVDIIHRISAGQFESELNKEHLKVIDIRKKSEFDAEHVEGAINYPLSQINNWVNEIEDHQSFYLHCAGGYRSMIAASILQARGIRNFKEIEGGYSSIAKTNINKTQFVCQSKI